MEESATRGLILNEAGFSGYVVVKGCIGLISGDIPAQFSGLVMELFAS